MFLNGNFVAQKAFQKRYGVLVDAASGTYAIPTKWQSALFQAGQCGAFIGVFLAGPITNRIGYRWTTILGLILMNATIFISFFVSIQSSPLRQGVLTVQYRPTRSPFSRLDKHSKVCLGVSLLQTLPPMLARLFPSPSEVHVRRRCK